MKKEDLKARVKEVVARVLKIDISEVEDDSDFIFDLGADSIQSIQMIAAFEEEFDIEMDEDGAVSIQTIGGAVDFIAGYIK